jgi:iduronate 2-sulfatase
LCTCYYHQELVEEDMPDAMIAEHAVQILHSFKANSSSPFFLAVGFHKPHLPHIAPAKYFDLYDLDSISLPDNASRHAPQNAPEFTWNKCGEFKSYHDVTADVKAESFNRVTPFSDETTRRQRRAYFAAASFADAQIGKVLRALEDTGFASRTVIGLWGDHGWHIGENNEWAKHTAMTWANRVPLLFSTPQHRTLTAAAAAAGTAAAGGPVVRQYFAELVDVVSGL